MHPFVFFAGMGVSALGLLAKFVRNDKHMWRTLEEAAGSEAHVPPNQPNWLAVEFPSGAICARESFNHGPTYYIAEAPADLAELPDFQISNDKSGMKESVPTLLGEGLSCWTTSPRAVESFIHESLRERLRALPGRWFLLHMRGKIRIQWPIHHLSFSVIPAGPLLDAVRIVEQMSMHGTHFLTHLAELSGASREEETVLLGGARLRVLWWRTDTATEITLDATSDVEPFVVNWTGGERSGPFPNISSPAFDTASLRFDGKALYLTVPNAEPELAKVHIDFLHRFLRAMRVGSGPFR
ncbi:MAG: hypothetical protein AB8H86_27475 [Polyangiales bacterium]